MEGISLNKKVLKEYIVSFLGTFLTAVGLVSFLMPNKIATGGANGIAIIINGLTGFPVGIIMYAVNIILFILSFILIGKAFGLRSIICTFVLNFFVDFLDRMVPFPKFTTDDYFLAVFLGVFISALGMAIVFSVNSSTGGTDILAKIASKYTGVSLGINLLFIDLTIGIMAGGVFNMKVGMYSVVSVILNGIVVDYAVRMIKSNCILTIITDHREETLDFIMKNMDRGASIIKATGAYTQQEKNMIYVAVNKKQKGEVVRKIHTIDPKAFVVVQESSDVIGYGFSDFQNFF
jgi:uncharacterized membrane-anchored protein YitT (DUF2179 family)